MIRRDRPTPASSSRTRKWVRARTALCALALTCLDTSFAIRDAQLFGERRHRRIVDGARSVAHAFPA